MPSSTTLPGARIGKYRILAHVATGGMAAVYKAQDEQLGRVVALKVLTPDLASNPILVERFKREARHAARLSHKNIVTLYEADSADGFHYLAMEFIEGIDLGEYIRRKGHLDPEEARRILIQACKALEHACAMGVTHRDIKPSNFLLANDEGRCRVKLADLGLARMSNEEDFRVTRAGTTVGTVDYMAPEQARDAALADVRSDIYSLGCTLYHMLAGQPPFAEGGIGERVYKHLAADPPDVRQFNDQVSTRLWAVVRRMLAKNPDDRYQTPTELIAALRSLTSAEPEADTSRSPRRQQAAPAPRARSRPPTPVPDNPDSVPALPVAPAPTPPSPRESRKRQSTMAEMPSSNTMAEPVDPLGISAEQKQAAAGQFAHATEVIRSGGDAAYAIQLLLSCCRLDPGNTLYRKLLREVVRDHGSKKSGWFGSFSNLSARSRLRAARKGGEHRKVIEDGEELLTRLPGDVSIQLEMADSAETLGLGNLAIWLLEEARQGAPQDVTLLRALAQVYENQKRYKQAITQWEKLRDLDPADKEPHAKIRELAVNETLSKGNFRR